MAKPPVRVCSEPGCNLLVRAARCDLHRREQRTARPSSRKQTDPFLVSSRWRRLRAAYLAQRPLCEDCTERGDTEAATEVHHKKKRTDRPELSLAWDNLQGLCKGCHSRRTRRGE